MRLVLGNDIHGLQEHPHRHLPRALNPLNHILRGNLEASGELLDSSKDFCGTA